MTTTHLLASTLLLAGACATGQQGTRPDDMTATEHLSAAREHSQQTTGTHAHTHHAVYPGYASYPWYYYGAYPWHYSWDPDEEHRALAAQHRDAAEQLKLQYASACAEVPRGLDATSPLETFTQSTSPIERGIVFHLSQQAGPPEIVLARLRCHRAWLKLAPSDKGPDDPLLVEGVRWTTHASENGVEVMATAVDDRGRDEVARRAVLVLEQARESLER